MSYELGVQPELSYWRDASKREVNLVVQRGLRPVEAIEIKSSATYNPRFFDVLERVAQNELGSSALLVFGRPTTRDLILVHEGLSF